MSLETILYGTVLFYDRFRGYGFVVPDAGGEEVFFPASEINLPKRQYWQIQRLLKVSYVLKPNTRCPEKNAFIAGHITPLPPETKAEPAPADTNADGGAK
jgi:cold shock CspA family protein